jgi:hypothetical protein
MPTLSSDPSRRVGLLSLIALVLAVVAVTLAAWALLQSHSSEPSYSDTERADAKVKACGAMDVVTNNEIAKRGISSGRELRAQR